MPSCPPFPNTDPFTVESPAQRGTLIFPEWWRKEGLALHTVEVGQGVRFYIENLFWACWNKDKFPEIEPFEPHSIYYPRKATDVPEFPGGDGKWYHTELAYTESGVCRFYKCEEKVVWPEGIPMESEMSIHGPFELSRFTDGTDLGHPQFFYWDIYRQQHGIDPDAIFGKKVCTVYGGFNGLGIHEAYVTRDHTWFLKTYKFYVCVWVLKGVIARDELIRKFRNKLIKIPALPPIVIYTHDTYSTYSEANMKSMPRGFDGSLKDAQGPA